jgi:DNA-binding GntR family transcriptional regulator
MVGDMDQSVDYPDQPDYTEALEEHSELVDRLAAGDVHALDTLMETVAGVRVVIPAS